MLAFTDALPTLCGTRNFFWSTAKVSQTCTVKFRLGKEREIKRSTLQAGLDVKSSRSQVLKHGVEAAVEEYVKSGLNICIGGGRTEATKVLLDAMSALYELSGLIDVAFVTSSASTRAMLEERELPNNLLVNFKKGIDLFIAPVTSMDSGCNALLDSDNFAGDKFAAQIARQIVLVILEEDLEKGKSGLRSVPVQVIPFLSDVAAESLCAGLLVHFGVRGATLRTDGTNIADVSLAPNILPHAIDYELKKLAQVISTGFLPASSRTIAVVATNDLQPIDMTPPSQSMSNLSEEDRGTALQGEKRERIIEAYSKDWKVISVDSGEMLFREFSFTSSKHAEAFIRYVHSVANEVRHFPEIKHRNTWVEIIVRTDCSGITELHALLSKELSNAYRLMVA